LPKKSATRLASRRRRKSAPTPAPATGQPAAPGPVDDLLHYIAAGVASSTGEPFFQRLTEYLGKALGVDYALVSTLDSAGQTLTTLSVFARGQHVENFSYALANTPCEQAIHGGGRVFTCTSGVQRDFPRNHMLTRMGVDSYSGVPLLASDGKPLGLLLVLHSGPLSNAALAELLLQIFAARAAAELERRANDQQLTRLNRLLRTISAVHQMMLHVSDRDRLLLDTCRILVEHGGLRMAWVGLADFDTGAVMPVAHAGTEFDYLDEVGVRCDDSPQGSGPTGTAIRTGQPVVNPDSETNPVFTPWRETARAVGYRSSAAFPLRVHGRVVGAVSAYAAEPNAFEAEETALLNELVATIGQRLTALDDAAAHELTDAVLRQRESDFRLLFEHNPLPMYIYDRDTYAFLSVNDAAVRQYGYTREEFLAMTIFDIRPPEEVTRLKRAIAETPSGLYLAAHWRHRKKSGEVFDAEVTAHRIDFEGRSAEFVMAVDVSERLRENAERRQTLELLRQSEERLRTAFEANSATTVILRLSDRVVLYVNRAWEEATGWSREAVLGRTITELGLWADGEERLAMIERARREGSVRNAEWRRRTRQGEIQDVLGSIERIEVDGSECVVIFTQDITERKRTEQELRENEERYRSVVAAMAEGIVIQSADGRIIAANRSAERILGLSLDQLSGRSSIDPRWQAVREDGTPFPGDEHPTMQTLRTGKPFSNVVMGVRRLDGTLVWISINTEPLRHPGTDAPYAVVASFHDITSRREAEQALRDSESRYRSIVETAQEGIWMTDADCRTTFANRKMAEILGCTVEEMTSRSMFDFMDDEGRAIAARNAKRRRQGIAEQHEFRFLRKDGRHIWTLQNTTPIDDPRGGYAGALAMVTDITERKRAEEALRHSEERFRKVFETTPVILSITRERDFVFVDVNDAFCEATGWTRGEAMGRTDLELGLWPDLDERQAMIAMLLAQGEMHDVEWRMRTRSGDVRHILGSTERIRLGDEPCVLVVGQDITERKRASEEMRKLSGAVEQTADSIMITDRRGVIEYVNPAFVHTTGFTPAEAIGRTPSIVKSGRHDEAFYREMWGTILAGGVYRDVMINRRKDGSLYYEEKTITPLKSESGEITHFVSSAKDITERMQVQERLQYLAHHDDLTRLPNRVLFLDRLSQALIRAHFHHRILAVLFLDLDHFKNINDSLGHNVGDQFLEATAVRLASCVREGDTVARLGGDEFAVLLEDIAHIEDISMVARKVLAAFASPFTVEAHELYLTTSIGVSLYPDDGADGHTLLKHADAAMYRAKELGRNNFQFYSADMSARAFERLTLETHLRHALERREFVLHYQPQVDVTSGRMVGVEALIRWQHPEFGLLGPQQFITLAEETGLIVPIGEWVTRTACEQVRAWREAGLGSIGVAVNLSGRQFNEPDFVDRMVRLVADSGMEAGLLEFELTEGTIMKNAPQTVDKLLALSNLGVRFAIDDFGTGYSSLSYLSRFPIHTLKIDRSFAQNAPRDANDAEIVKTIIAMARSLKLAVIAEGVEEAEQLALLRSQGCAVMQGYHFCRPVPAEEITRLLQSGRRLA
jgi:diguanylate cyclase (GGDEF)-like protein/PAS domain S-box-containing protein